MRRAVLLAASVLTLALVGCTDDENDPSASTSTTPASTPSTSPAGPAPGAWSLEGVRVDRIPRDPPLVESALPASFPADDARLPDLLADPPGRARLAYHPRETFDDRNGWADERVFFLGTDGAWRSLEMLDLGLPESTHPGVDTYGAGELSPDGTRWAAKTNDGIVLLDLRTARARVVPLPGAYTGYLVWRPDGSRVDVVRQSGGPSTYRTWSIDPLSLRPSRAAHRLPIDGYAPDGSVVTFSRRDGRTVRTVNHDGTQVTDVVPMPYRRARLGGAVGPTRTLFGLNRGMFVVESRSTAPIAQLRMGPRDGAGWPRGWWGEDMVWFYEWSRGLLSWDVTTGELGTLVRVRPGTRRDSYWTTSVAIDLMR
jgi:hypothetical protein